MAQGTCSIDGCDVQAVARGWCQTHYRRWKTHGDTGPATLLRDQPKPPCSVEDCTSATRSRGLCNRHYTNLRKYGDPLVTAKTLRITECIMEACGGTVRGRGLCGTHYARWWRNGDASFSAHDKDYRTALFWADVDRDGPVPAYAPELGPCWLWCGKLGKYDYGLFSLTLDGVCNNRAYRVAYALCVGPIPDGLELDHLCRVSRCVNPAHLEPVTGAENKRRATEARRLERRLTA